MRERTLPPWAAMGSLRDALAPFLGRQVEIIVIDDEPQSRPPLVTRGMFAVNRNVAGDPLADVLAELRAERARQVTMTAEEVAE